MDGRAAFIVSGILSDREARSATFGLENPLATRFWTAVKTGTSKDMRDNWCVGYSERYTVGVWVGNFSGEPMWNVSGMAGAAPVWLDIMNHLHRRSSSKAPKPQPGVVMKQVSFRGDLEPRRQEWFIAGTEPDDAIARERRHEIVRIVYPQPATIITLDPDIPADLQRISFVGKFTGETHEWRLDEQAIGSSTSLLWKPERGRHVLSLIDGENNDRRLGNLHREITPSFFIHSPQPAYPANTFFVVCSKKRYREENHPCAVLSLPLQVDTIPARQGPGCYPERVAANRRGLKEEDRWRGFFYYSFLPAWPLSILWSFPTRKDKSEREDR